MPIRFWFLSAVFACQIGLTLAQTNTFIGIEGGVGKSIFQTSPLNGARLGGDVSMSFGLVLEQELNKTLSIQTGLIEMNYNMLLLFDPSTDAGIKGLGTQAFRAWQIPLRLNAKYNLYRNKLFFKTTLGYIHCINADFNTWGRMSGGTFNDYPGSDTLNLVLDYNPGLRKTFGLIQSRAGIELLIFKKVVLDLNANYYAGLNDVASFTLTSYTNQTQTGITTGIGKGDYWNVGLSLSYPISDLWQKRSTP